MHLSPGEDVTAIRLLEKASERELAKRESAPSRGPGKQGERGRKPSKKRKKNN